MSNQVQPAKQGGSGGSGVAIEMRSVDIGIASDGVQLCVLLYKQGQSSVSYYSFKNGGVVLGTPSSFRRYFGSTAKTDVEIQAWIGSKSGKPCNELEFACFLCDQSVKFFELELMIPWVKSEVKKKLKVDKTSTAALAVTNCVYVSRRDFNMLTNAWGQYVVVEGFPQHVFTARWDDSVSDGKFVLNNFHRTLLRLGLNEDASVSSYKVPTDVPIALSTLTVEVDFLQKQSAHSNPIDAKKLTEMSLQMFERQFFTVGQKFLLEYSSSFLTCSVIKCEVIVNVEGDVGEKPMGRLDSKSFIQWKKIEGSSMVLTGASSETKARSLLQKDWDFSKFGIGGLANEFNDIFRRAFASRLLPPGIVAKAGIPHAKGMLLYGPPGTGKTLLARQIGKMLNSKEPKIVNGPEILSKYVGQAEENVRALFKDAETEYKARGEDSDLHIIIFDEIDAICRQRGSRNDGTGVGDTVVNQLLSKIDGVESLNNILIIGMTNRKDMIDEALLRPGRLEILMEINLPTEKGREEILMIHTTKIRNCGWLDPLVDIKELAKKTKNFSGAELEGLVKSATSYAYNRQINTKDPSATTFDASKMKVTHEDFDLALREVLPAFGIDKDQFENCAPHGIIQYSDEFTRTKEICSKTATQLRTSEKTKLISLLVKGPPGSGKTAFATKLALESEFPFMKVVSPADMVGMSEQRKLSYISKIFDDAYKSPLSVIIMDDLERLIEYVDLGNQFSNIMLQTLLIITKKPPPKNNKLFIIGTVSDRAVFQRMELTSVFDMQIELKPLGTAEIKHVLKSIGALADTDLNEVDKVVNDVLPIKKLLLVIEMARASQSTNMISLEQFVLCLDNFVHQT